MTDLVSIATVIDYVEARLRQPVAVADMASSISYSLYHFCRMFNAATHHPPYDYLMRRRLSESALALLRSDRKIIDIALEYQFNNPETFSRAFKRMFGTQPSRLRKQGSIDSRRLMPRLAMAHLRHIESCVHLQPSLVEVDTFQVTGFQTLVRDDGATIFHLWALLDRELASFPGSPPDANYIGLRYYPDRWEETGMLYLAGIETRGLSIPGAVVKTLPAQSCASFVHTAPASHLNLTLDYAYHTWSPRSGTALSHRWVIEQYGHDTPSTSHRPHTTLLIPIEHAPRS
jgi:AraC family transcriptional regulator